MSKRILILGGDGMLGHQLLESFNHQFQVMVTLRKDADTYNSYNYFNSMNSLYGIEATSFDVLKEVFSHAKPEIVINCIGIVKQRLEANDAVESIKINALLPHQLSLLCAEYSARLIQISTDCVFSGNKGNYTESDIPDAKDLYGRSKLLGEVSSSHAITLRTSIIGLELSRKQGLIEWFLSQHGKIKGYAHAIYSGFTTIELASIIEVLITKYTDLTGVWHVSSDPISKYQLLCTLTKKLKRQDVEIIVDEEFRCDRSFDGSKFNAATIYTPPSWDKMLDKLAEQINNRK